MKKRSLALCLCICLVLALLPAASAAGTGGLAADQIPSFGSALGYCLDGDDEEGGGYYKPGKQSSMGHDELLQCAQEYVDLVLEHCPFTLIRGKPKTTSWSGGSCTSYYLRYTGTAEMASNMTGDYFEKRDYYPYHLYVAVWEYEGKNWITLSWDDNLEAVETGLRTPTGERLGQDRPSLTVVMALGYPKMAVGDEVVPVDSQNANVYPIAENGRTLVPISPIVEAFGGQAIWDSRTNNAIFTLGDRTVSHVIGSSEVTVQAGGRTQKTAMDVPSIAMNNRTYVPVRYVLEGLGLWLAWEPTYNLIIISTDDLSSVEDLVELEESQRLFASEEVPEVPRHTRESYTLDGGQFTMEVGEALRLYNAHTPISTYYSYEWTVLDGGELVKLDRSDATCKFYAKRPGTVTVRVKLDQWIQGYAGDQSIFDNEQTFTITITPATEQGSGGGLMKWQTCPSCHGTGTIRSGTRQIQCPTCLGRKQVLLP